MSGDEARDEKLQEDVRGITLPELYRLRLALACDVGGYAICTGRGMALQYFLVFARTAAVVMAFAAQVACNRDTGGSHDNAPPGPTAHSESAQRLSNESDDSRGREVTVHARSQDVANDVAFWIHHEGRRLLVVVNRDRRSDAQRYTGVPAMHGIANMAPNVPVTVSGRVEPLPHPEAMYSWNLTSADRAALRLDRSYLRAETVTPR